MIMQKEVIDNISADLNFTSIFSLIVVVSARKPSKCLSNFCFFFNLVHLEQGRIERKACRSETNLFLYFICIAFLCNVLLLIISN